MDKEYVKQYFRDWVETESCPWYIQDQYCTDNSKALRPVKATGQANRESKKLPQYEQAKKKEIADLEK